MPQLLREVKAYYKNHKRNLPWRHTRDPYKILVSEVMLQQTQVERVVPFYRRFIKKFPTARALSRARLSDVLALWQGLGYNRRARYLHEAAKVLATEGFSGQKLPGVGPYTRGAVEAFAFNKPGIFIETNIRTVFLHRFHSSVLQNTRISDTQLLPLVAEALKKSGMPPREFYYSVMDYGAHLKKKGVRLNHRSKEYARQSKFEGSARQLRGALVRALIKKPATLSALTKDLARRRGEVDRELIRLQREGLLALIRGRYHIAE